MRRNALYRRATESDPDYALAFFDLGNVLDELQKVEEAVAAYERALKLVPRYADAHYNLALAYRARERASPRPAALADVRRTRSEWPVGKPRQGAVTQNP